MKIADCVINVFYNDYDNLIKTAKGTILHSQHYVCN